MSTIVKNTLVYTIGRLLPQFTSFLLLPLYTKYLTPKEYGVVESMLTLGVVLSVFFSMAAERSMFRLYYDYNSEKEKKIFIGNISMLIVVISTFVLGNLILFQDLVSKIYVSISFRPYFLYAIFNAYVLAFAFIPQTLYQVKEKAVSFVIITTASFVLGVFFILYYVVVQKEGAVGLLKGKMIGNVIMLPLYFIIIYRNSIFQISKKNIKEIFSFSLPMIPTLITAWVLNLSNRIFIERFFSMEEVGIFSMAFKISSLLSVLLGAIFTAYNPVFYRLANSQDYVQSKKKIKELNNFILSIIILFGFCLTFFSKELVYYFLNEDFFESLYLIPIITFSFMLIQISTFYNLMIYQSKKTTIIMIISIISAFLSVVFNYAFIPVWGMKGAAWSLVLCSFFLLVFKILYARKMYYIEIVWTKYFLISFLLIVLLYLDRLLGFNNVNIVFVFKILLCLTGLFFLYKRNSFKLKLLIKS